MRILMISDHADPLAKIGSIESGGQNIYVRYLAEQLAKLGVGVDVYTRWDDPKKKEVVTMSPWLRVIRVKAGPKGYMERDLFGDILPEFVANIAKRIHHSDLNYALIHSNYWYSGLAGLELAERFQIPLIHVYHSIGRVRYETLKPWLKQQCDSVFFQRRQAAEKRLAHQAAHVVTTSPVERDLIHKLFEVPIRRVTSIPGGVDTSIFRPVDQLKAKTKIGFDHDKLILYVGRLEWRKGVTTLLEAMPEVLGRHPDSHLAIIGGPKKGSNIGSDVKELARLQQEAQNLGLDPHVSFLGAIDQPKLHLYYSAADVSVVPSYYESFGFVPLEAMACGTPVVASKTGGLQYTVADGKTGYLAPPRDVAAFAKKINLVLTNGKASYQQACLDRIHSQFRWPAVAAHYVNLFAELLRSQYENRAALAFRRTRSAPQVRRHGISRRQFS